MPWRPAAAGARPGKLFATPEHRLLVLQSLWPHVVGPAVAQNSAVVAVRVEVMTERVTDARWRRALFRMHRDIIVRYREHVGSAAPGKLGFLDGGLTVAPVPAAGPVRGADPAPSEELVQAAEAIEDPELRASFLRTAGQYLENRRSGHRRALPHGGAGHA